MEKYRVSGKLGEGAHGLVLKGHHISSGRDVALKRVLLRNIKEGIPNTVIREIKSLQQIDCEYVVELLDVFAQGLGFVLVFEYMPSGLWEMLNDYENPLSASQVKAYMIMLLKGVAYLHQNSIMHRDLKPANLLISKEGILKIADLGQGCIYSGDCRQYSHQVATRWYRAPELLYGAKSYTPAVDLWAVGCIFGEMINNSPIFPGENDIEQLAIVLHTLGSPTHETWPGLEELPDYHKITFTPTKGIPWIQILPDPPQEAISLIKKFLLYDQNKRISAEKALFHPYFFTLPIASNLEDMPKPKENHRRNLKPKEIEVNQNVDDLFQDLRNLLKPKNDCV